MTEKEIRVELHQALGGAEGYPPWVAALAFIAFIFVISVIGGVFAEFIQWVIGLF